jgi:cytochrome c
MFYLPGGSVNYKVKVTDKEDGSTEAGTLKSDKVIVTVDYMAQGFDKTAVAQGHQRPEMPGKILIAENDCKSCHQIDQKSAGPAYRMVARKYKDDVNAIDKLAEKVMKGGAGVWGETPMAAHPQLNKDQAIKMVEYILSLSEEKKIKSLPLQGSAKFATAPKEGAPEQSAYLINASYEDSGNAGIPSLSAASTKVLRAPVLSGGDAELNDGIRKLDTGNGGTALENIHPNSSVIFRNIDLTGIGRLDAVIAEADKMKGGQIEIYLGSEKDGKKLGTISFAQSPKVEVMKGIFMRTSSLAIPAQKGIHDILVVFKNEGASKDDLLFYFSRINLNK